MRQFLKFLVIVKTKTSHFSSIRTRSIQSRRIRICVLTSALAAAFLLPTQQAKSEGLRNPPPGAFALGRAGGKIAHIDDASAVHHNPANIIGIDSLTAAVAPNFVYIGAEFQSSVTGETAETKDPWKVLPNLFVAMPLKKDRYSAGLSIITPYGVSNEWKREGAYGPGGVLRYASPYFTELKTINIAPTFAARITDKLSVGAGINAMWSEVDFRQMYPTFLVGGAGDGEVRARGDGVGFGVNLGLTYKLTDRQTLALTYRSPVSVNYDGKFTMFNPPPGTPDRSHFGSHIKFPTIIALGYGVQVTDKIRVETDFEWLEWSNFNQLPLTVGAPPPLLPSSLRQAWNNGFTAGIGGDWKFAEDWVARASYQYYNSPIPDDTFSNSIPGANQNVVTVSLGYKRGKHSVEAAFSEVFYDERNITFNQNPALLGTHQTTVHLLALTYQMSF